MHGCIKVIIISINIFIVSLANSSIFAANCMSCHQGEPIAELSKNTVNKKPIQKKHLENHQTIKT